VTSDGCPDVRRVVGVLLAAVVAVSEAHAGAFIFAGESYGIGRITHPTGYTGSGGPAAVTVCIDPSSANAAQMAVPLQNIAATWNALTPTTGNVKLGGGNDIPSGQIDFESVALHEVGHCLGLAHPNLATESGLGEPDRNFTKATAGGDGTYDLGIGADGVRGSTDDLRDDDVNLHWFRRADNDPFTVGAVADTTTYSVLPSELPSGHTSVANADRTVSSLFGVPNTESVMQQGSYTDEDQRALAGDDVGTMRLAMSGLDGIQGTADDYTLAVQYVGLTSSCDVVLDFDDGQTGFAVCQASGTFMGGSHARITSGRVYFNTGYNWYFNQALSTPVTTTTTSSTSTSSSTTSSTTSSTSTSSSTSSSSSTTTTSTSTTTSSTSTSTSMSSSSTTSTSSTSTTSTTASSSTTTSSSVTTSSTSTTSTSSSSSSSSSTSSSTSTSTTSTTSSTTTTAPTIPSAGCGDVPVGGCIVATRGLLHVKEASAGHERLKLLLKAFGASTLPSSFGNPVFGASAFDVCIYDASSSLVGALRIDRAGEECRRGRSCWRPMAAGGFRYADPNLAAHGARRLLLRGGAAGQGQISLVAKNASQRGLVAMPTGITAALAGDPWATVQVVVSDGACFELVADDVRMSEPAVFRGLAD